MAERERFPSRRQTNLKRALGSGLAGILAYRYPMIRMNRLNNDTMSWMAPAAPIGVGGAIALAFLGMGLSFPAMGQAPREAETTARAEAVLKKFDLPFKRLTSVHYDVVYVGSMQFAADRRVALEATYRNVTGFFRRLGIPLGADTGRLTVVVLETREQMEQFFKATRPMDEALSRWVAGYHDPTAGWAVFYNQFAGESTADAQRQLEELEARLRASEGSPHDRVNVSRPNGTEVQMTKAELFVEIQAEKRRLEAETKNYNTRVTQHEGAHQLAFRLGLQKADRAYPFWISEGLACTFETPAAAGSNRMGAAALNAYRLESYRKAKAESRTLGLARLLSIKEPGPDDDVEALYSESWAYFSFLFQRYPKELAAYLRFLAGTEALPEPTDRANGVDSTAPSASAPSATGEPRQGKPPEASAPDSALSPDAASAPVVAPPPPAPDSPEAFHIFLPKSTQELEAEFEEFLRFG